MRRCLQIALPAATFAAGLLPAAAPAAAAPTAGVRVLECRERHDSSEARARFRAVARRVRDTHTMRIHLRLQERTARTRWRNVGAPGLGVWRRSRAGVRRFAIRQRVLGLARRSAYRVVAGFRWYDADGRVLRRARRRSSVCPPRGRIANLRVRRVFMRPFSVQPDVDAYDVVVVNRGRARSRATSLRVRIDGRLLDVAQVPPLRPRRSRIVRVTGPPCGSVLVARVDPQDAVLESDERDNILRLPCGPV